MMMGQAVAVPMVDISYVETDLGGGLWEYDFTVSNTGDPVADAGFNVYDVFFTFDLAITASVVSLPMDWDGIDGPGFFGAFSLLPGEPPFGADIGPGASLGGFVLQFDAQVADLAYEAMIENPLDFFEPVILTGTATDTSQIPVPEPSTLVLLCAGLVGITMVRRRTNA